MNEVIKYIAPIGLIGYGILALNTEIISRRGLPVDGEFFIYMGAFGLVLMFVLDLTYLLKKRKQNKSLEITVDKKETRFKICLFLSILLIICLLLLWSNFSYAQESILLIVAFAFYYARKKFQTKKE